MKEVFAVPAHNLLAIVLGVGVGVAGLYISLWDGNFFSVPSISEQKDFYTLAGLQNLGNNCYLNVILQALSSTSSFLSFLQNMLHSDHLAVGEKNEKLPLTIALSSLLEELYILGDEKKVLSPRKVMLEMSSYACSFNLTRQQDAAEAFIHLLTALEEEISDCYMPHDVSLADTTGVLSRIYKPNTKGHNECERWKQQFIGPFDGTMASFLTCKSCSSMLSLDFEFFRCLPLSPVLDRRAEIMAGCTVMDCFKHFTAAEHVENYRCSRCWHAAALKYLSGRREKDEAKYRKIDHCVNLESCDCSRSFNPEEITWTGYSCASKQLSIARCPRILCIHLQRAFMNEYGEFVKMKGHISFPLILDIFPYTQANASLETSEKCLLNLEKHQRNPLIPQFHNVKMHQNIQMLPQIYRIVNDKVSPEFSMGSISGKLVNEALGHPPIEMATGGGNMDSVGGSGIYASDDLHSGLVSGNGLSNKMYFDSIDSSTSSKKCMYLLSSVVEHYGRPGSGHYVVYKRVNFKSFVGPSESSNDRWFYVSDSEVSAVSEETVLAAEASLLFYEIIDTKTSVSIEEN